MKCPECNFTGNALEVYRHMMAIHGKTQDKTITALARIKPDTRPAEEP